ncbi:hypothetical protein EJ06DRAFT_124955 [Trichodelitschia bisporula]|uniref:Uncharacterized protein n=1 Tax=Trichodelitschia bisporula TaxID=703511 RepID=A0A6G1HQJ7_9PEZI|nr:hypothetical protein EJ06DRAFT_124955 [Trichodelitschia bisporula]
MEPPPRGGEAPARHGSPPRTHALSLGEIGDLGPLPLTLFSSPWALHFSPELSYGSRRAVSSRKVRVPFAHKMESQSGWSRRRREEHEVEAIVNGRNHRSVLDREESRLTKCCCEIQSGGGRSGRSYGRSTLREEAAVIHDEKEPVVCLFLGAYICTGESGHFRQGN